MPGLLRRGSRGAEVVALQENLNHVPGRYVPAGSSRLATDGAFGRLTDERVRLFQRNAGLKVDGLVGPNTQAAVLKALTEAGATASAPATPVAAPTPSASGSQHSPREVPKAEFHLIEGGTHGRWGVDLIGESAVRHGQRWDLGSQERIILEVLDQAVVYYLAVGPVSERGRVFAQTRTGFRSDVRASVLSDAAGSAQGMVVLAELEAYFLLGALSAVNVGTAALVLSLDALRIYAENQRQVEAAMRLAKSVLEARRVLKQHAPALWDRIFYRALFEALGVVHRNLDSFLRDPNRLARISGAIVTCVGVSKLPSRAGALKLAAAVALQIVKGAIVQSAISPNLDREKKRLVRELSASGVSITNAQVEQIQRELEKNPALLQRTLQKLKRDLDAVRI